MAAEAELSRLRHAPVCDRAGVKLGKISEIFLNDQTQQISFVTVSLGILRNKEVYVPYSLVRDADAGLMVDVPRAVIEAAPRVNGVGYLTALQEKDLVAFYANAEEAFPVDRLEK